MSEKPFEVDPEFEESDEKDELTLKVNADVDIERPTLVLMEELFGDSLDVQDDYEYAIAVLLGYGVGRTDGDIHDALEEIQNTI